MQVALSTKIKLTARQWLLASIVASFTIGAVSAQGEFKDVALDLMSSNDFDAAIALINRAHEQGQADAESYSILADAYLNSGSGIPAEAAIDRARQLGADYAATAVPFAKSLLIQGQFRRALEALRGVSIPDADRGDALIITGDANFAERDYENARRFYLSAVQQFPADFQAYLGLARLELKEGNLKQAKTYADQAYDRSRDNTMVQYTRGLLARYAGDVELAEEFFEDAIRLFPGNVMANLELAGIRINQRRFEEAEQNLDTVYASTPKNPMALYLSGVILSSRGEYAEAEALLNRARVATENYLPALYVRGLVAYQLENNEVAIELLNRVLQVRPANRTARLALSASYLRLQQPTNAYNALVPLINQGQDDVTALAMAAAILIAQGDADRGRAMYERVALLSGEEGEDAVDNLDTKLALAQFVAGDSENALSTLSQVTSSQNAQLRDLGVMGSMQLRTKDYDGARITIAKVLDTAPDRALGYNMRGTLEFQERDFDSAAESFTQALTRKPDYYTALRNRALALMNLRQYNRAENDLERLLEEEPTDTLAKAALGKVLLLNDKAEEAVPYFREAVRLIPQSIELWADYSQALADSGNTTRAIEEARATAVKAAENPEILKRMGVLLLDLDQARAAERPLSRYAAFNYNNGEANLLHGRALLKTGLFSGARMAFQRAGRAEDEPVPTSTINWYLFATEAMGQKLDEAENRLPTLRAFDRPDDVPPSLIGQVFLDKGEPELAASAFREAMRTGSTDDLVIGLSKALFATGARQAGIRELEDYLSDAEVSRLARVELARRYEQEERFSDAALQYERLLQTGVADADVVAKLALVYLQLGNRASTQLAERAFLMAPENPAILDAAGWVALQADRETNKAIDYLEKAVRRAPADPVYKYHLGIAYVAKGDRRAARRVLQQALNLNPVFPGADDARRQLQELAF